MVVMAVRADQSLVYGLLSGGHSDDKGRSARCRATDGRLAPAFCGPVRPKGVARHSLVYLKGLLSNLERKSVEPIALQFSRRPDGGAATQNEVVALQGFVTSSPWEAGNVFAEIQAVFAEELVPSTSQWSIGTVGVIDESGFVKAGTESVGVANQWCGRVGKTTNCQVGVFLTGVTPAGVSALDAQLFLTEEWIADRQRRQEDRRSAGGAVSDEAADRGGDDPQDVGRGQGAFRLDHRR